MSVREINLYRRAVCFHGPDVIARLSATPGRVRSAGGAIGADTDRILIDELGMSPGTVADLRARKVVA